MDLQSLETITYLLVFQLNDFELRKGKKLGVTISFNNHRLFVGNIPKNRDRDELLDEFTKHAREYYTQKFTCVLSCTGQNTVEDKNLNSAAFVNQPLFDRV